MPAFPRLFKRTRCKEINSIFNCLKAFLSEFLKRLVFFKSTWQLWIECQPVCLAEQLSNRERLSPLFTTITMRYIYEFIDEPLNL